MMNYDLDKLGMSKEELFSTVDKSDLESEKITAPRYSYWQSVFRVFFKKKVNIFALALLGVVVLLTYLYPVFFEYDKFGNIMDGSVNTSAPALPVRTLTTLLEISLTSAALAFI